MDDEFVLTLSDLVLFLVANTLISGFVGFFLDFVMSRAFAQPDDLAERMAVAQEAMAEGLERLADVAEEQNLSRAIEGRKAESNG